VDPTITVGFCLSLSLSLSLRSTIGEADDCRGAGSGLEGEQG
jgi:hypothetical protein